MQKKRTTYYHNSTASFNIVLSGDIEINPGPGIHNNPKCSACQKGVGTNRKRFKCNSCLSLTHLSCTTTQKKQYKFYNSRSAYSWTCTHCTLSTLPFFYSRDINLDEINITLNQPRNDSHLDLLRRHRSSTSIAHINTQSLLSSFDEFCVMMNSYNFDIVTLSETWLQDNKHQLDYVSIKGYESVFVNRKGQRGGGVGFYIRENLSFKARFDLTKNYSLEALCVEFRGRNKNTPFLILTVYQPSSREDEKLKWLLEFEELLADIMTKWTGIIFVTGDMNIDLLGNEKESSKRYKDILSSYNLFQLIKKPTRKLKTLIDHIITNIPNKVIRTDVLETDEISDHDTPYILSNIKKERFEPRYKYVTNVRLQIGFFTSSPKFGLCV